MKKEELRIEKETKAIGKKAIDRRK